MRRTALNRLARQKIAEYARINNLTRCEARLDGCWGEANAPAHRHKRSWYYDQPDELLWDPDQWIPCCQHCHNIMEFDAELTAQIFNQLKGHYA